MNINLSSDRVVKTGLSVTRTWQVTRNWKQPCGNMPRSKEGADTCSQMRVFWRGGWKLKQNGDKTARKVEFFPERIRNAAIMKLMWISILHYDAFFIDRSHTFLIFPVGRRLCCELHVRKSSSSGIMRPTCWQELKSSAEIRFFF